MITVYGKKSCAKCESFKQKLGLLDVKYYFVDLEDFGAWTVADYAGKRNMAGAMATYQHLDTLPIVLIHDKFYAYAEAIAELKGRNA